MRPRLDPLHVAQPACLPTAADDEIAGAQAAGLDLAVAVRDHAIALLVPAALDSGSLFSKP